MSTHLGDRSANRRRARHDNGLPVFAVSLSPTWRGIVLTFSTRESIAIPLKSSIGFKVGDDNNIWSWIDSWLGTPAPLHNLFPRLFNLSLQQSVGLANMYSPIDNSISLALEEESEVS